MYVYIVYSEKDLGNNKDNYMKNINNVERTYNEGVINYN